MAITQAEYDKMVADNKAIDMIRWKWDRLWKPDPEGVTVVICQGKQRMNTQLCLESLLRFYPEIKIVVVNGSPDDFDSSYYLKYMAAKHRNIKVLPHKDTNGHGWMMDRAIREAVTDEYVLLMDNDTIVKRGGWVRDMKVYLELYPSMFAVGTLMVVSRKNEACGVPHDEKDLYRYAHPSCSMIRRSMYLQLRPFVNHGAPCWATMADAEKKGWSVESFPVDEFVMHLSGASWCKPVTIWTHDNDVMTRPFISFIVVNPEQLKELEKQTDHDFEIHVLGTRKSDHVIYHDGTPPTQLNNRLYDLRFRLKGEYVVLIPESAKEIYSTYVQDLRRTLIDSYLPDEMNVGGIVAVRRNWFQYRECITSTL